MKARPTDISLVIVGGSPVYGDEELMQSLAPNTPLEAVWVCGMKKVLDFETEQVSQGKSPKSWNDTVKALTKALKPLGLTPSELTPCP